VTSFVKFCDAAVLILIVFVLVFTPFAFGGINQTQALLSKTFLSPVLFYSNYFARLGIALAVMLWFLGMISAREIKFAKTPLDIPIALFVGYTLLWFMFSSARYVIGAELANIIAYVALYYLVVNNVRTKLRMNIIAGALLFSGFVIATIGLIQLSGYFLPSSEMKLDYAINLLRPKQYWGRVGGTFVCPNHFAGYMEMVVPFAMAYVLFANIPLGRKILLGFCGLVMTIGLLLSISRGGWAGFGVSATFLFIAATKEKKVPKAARTALLVVTLIAVAVVLAKSAYVKKRFVESFSKEDSSYLKRAHLWIDSLSLVRDNLLIGTGPGTFDLTFREYRRPSFLLAAGYPHNDYINTLSDYGIVGFVILLFGIVLFAKKLWASTDRLRRRMDKAHLYAIMAAFIALLVHSLVDFNMHIPSNALTMAAIVAIGMCIRQYRVQVLDEWVAMTGRKPKLFPPALRNGLSAVVVIVTAGLLYMNFKSYASMLVLHQATEKDPSQEFLSQNPDEKHFQEAERLYKKSASFFAANAKTWASLAEMYLWRSDDALAKGQKNKFFFLLLGAKEARNDCEKAARAVKEAIDRNRLDPRYYLTLARAYAGIAYVNREYKQGSPTQYSPALDKYEGMAIAEFQKALQMDPNNAVYHEHLGFFYYRTGRFDQAEKEVQQALEIVPDNSLYVKERKHLQKRLDDIRRARQETERQTAAFSFMESERGQYKN